MLLIVLVVPLPLSLIPLYRLAQRQRGRLRVPLFERNKAAWRALTRRQPWRQGTNLLLHHVCSLQDTFQWHHGAQEFRLPCRYPLSLHSWQ